MDDDDLDYDPHDPEVIAAREAVGRAIAAYLNVIRKDQNPFVVAWAVGAEWTCAEFERNAEAGRDVITNHDQPISASLGLGHFIRSAFE